MTKTQEKKIMKTAINTYGRDAQIDKCIEEMAELTKALLKHRHGLGDPDTEVDLFMSCIEEIADVEIMLDQMKMLFSEAGVSVKREKKLLRLAERLGMVKNG